MNRKLSTELVEQLLRNEVLHGAIERQLALDLIYERREAVVRALEEKQQIRWRGSVTDFATDCACLLTREQGFALAEELMRFAANPKLHEKFKAGDT